MTDPGRILPAFDPCGYDIPEALKRFKNSLGEALASSQTSLVSAQTAVALAIIDMNIAMGTVDKLLATNAEIAAARRVLASSTATKAEKADAAALLHSLGKDQAEYLLELASAGETGSKAYKDGIKALKLAIKNATGPTKIALQGILNQILLIEKTGKVIPINFVIKHATGKGPTEKALGGPVTAGQPYIVGDGGRPELFVPDSNGTILPRVPGASGGTAYGGGSITINFQTMFAPTAAQAQLAARAIIPELTREMRRQSIL